MVALEALRKGMWSPFLRRTVASEWEAPKFTGTFLPTEREVTDTGFAASWTVTHLNRSFPQAWTGKNYIPSDEAFGVDLILESDHYTKAERSAKYGLLFIALTFLVLIIIELRSEKKVHIFYYLLVALALLPLAHPKVRREGLGLAGWLSPARAREREER